MQPETTAIRSTDFQSVRGCGNGGRTDGKSVQPDKFSPGDRASTPPSRINKKTRPPERSGRRDRSVGVPLWGTGSFTLPAVTSQVGGQLCLGGIGGAGVGRRRNLFRGRRLRSRFRGWSRRRSRLGPHRGRDSPSGGTARITNRCTRITAGNTRRTTLYVCLATMIVADTPRFTTTSTRIGLIAQTQHGQQGHKDGDYSRTFHFLHLRSQVGVFK